MIIFERREKKIDYVCLIHLTFLTVTFIITVTSIYETKCDFYRSPSRPRVFPHSGFGKSRTNGEETMIMHLSKHIRILFITAALALTLTAVACGQKEGASGKTTDSTSGGT